jgi:hypothetical protein
MGKEFSLENPRTQKIYQFPDLDSLFKSIKAMGEVDAWIIRVHYL